jgi:hypothetical protein
MPKHGREEEKWGEGNEIYMHNIIKICKNRADQHEQAGYHFKGKNTHWGLPLVLVPVIMSPISVLIDEFTGVSKYINAGAFLATGVLGGVVSFFKYGEKMSDHFHFSSRYADIVTDIEAELVKGREYRTQLDVFSTRTKMIVDSLANTEPTLPKFILDDVKYENPPKHNYMAVSQDGLEVVV